MSAKEIEEKMNLDESLCCSRKRKRKRRKSLSNDEDDEDDQMYIPRSKNNISPVPKKRKTIKKTSTPGTVTNSNGFTNKNDFKHEPDLADLLVPCEQTLEEGDAILEPKDLVPIKIIKKSFVVTRPIQAKPVTIQSKPMTVIPNASCFGAIPIKSIFQLNMPPGSKSVTLPKTSNLPLRPILAKENNLDDKTKRNSNVIDLGSDDETEVVKALPIRKSRKQTFLNHKAAPVNNHTEANKRIRTFNVDHSPSVRSTPEINITENSNVPLVLQQRDQRFKKMLYLQSQEIDKTVTDLKNKISKMMQDTSLKSNQDTDLLESAALCTRRFSRAIRKTLVELSTVNDRLLKDYVHWKKKFPINTNSLDNKSIIENQSKVDEPTSENKLSLEMTCTRDSDSECEDQEENQNLKLLTGSVESSTILDHLTLFKKKICSVKAVGDSSVLLKDKATQADDVPYRNYEKCIGYSLLSRSEIDPSTENEVVRPVKVSDENFGKYQEHFIYHLQHIEDFGIQTNEEIVSIMKRYFLSSFDKPDVYF